LNTSYATHTIPIAILPVYLSVKVWTARKRPYVELLSFQHQIPQIYLVLCHTKLIDIFTRSTLNSALNQTRVCSNNNVAVTRNPC